ncbi:hypothetical protein [Thermococcus barophilus]|uniref:KaiC-like domain-containing protein n=1 Tax=Thermococcus barophilus (strain DSM 11836 / MP) TaxID=391623 RepID=F0LN62_THEBM|nr:hypothetical protein [Thermococcus barophilus]ADT85201.1 hypothetical protein TERMP_02228 [Thermococcus barophilus MP]
MAMPRSIRECLGEIIPAGILLVSYNQYSLGWKVGIKLAKEEIDSGGFAIITNIAIPFRKFCARVNAAGLDIIKEGEQGKLAVINVFKEEVPYDFVYSLEDVDESTFIPKYVEVKKEIVKKYGLGKRKVIHVFATLDTLYTRFGEDVMRELFMARLYAGEELVLRGFNFWDVLIVNRDSIPKELHSWMVTISDYVIMTQGILKEQEFIENISVLKGVSKNFRPIVFQVRTSTISIPSEMIY